VVRILLVSTERASLTDLKTGLEENDARVIWAESCDSVLSMVKEEEFDLIITDKTIADIKGLECIKKLISLNPMVNSAAISFLSPGDFHEASEGLGVLMQLPVRPGKKDAKKLLNHLKNILNLTKKTN